MNIARISWVFLSFELVSSYVEGAKWSEDLTRYIAEDSGARQVALITYLAENETTTSSIIDDISMRLVGVIPVLSINIEADLNRTNDSPPNNDFEDSYGIGTGATFFFLIHESLGNEPVLPSRRFVNAVINMATLHYDPKFLILFVGRETVDSFEELLRYAWTRRVLDLTIVEWVEPRRLLSLRTETRQSDFPIIHRFNPFKNEYTKRKWNRSNIPLLPKKVDDMNGFPLRIRAVDSEPFTIAKFDKLNQPTKIGGANMNLLFAIAERMNASLTFLPALFAENPKDVKNIQDLIYYKGELQKMDLHSYLSVRLVISKYGSLRTTSIKLATMCAVVPILSAPRTPVLTQFLFTYLFVILIILIFWVIARVLRFTSPVWGFVNIANMLIGVAESRPPHSNVERIILVTLITVSSIYSSSIYAAITELSLETTGELEFNSIEDLDRSGLRPIISIFDFNTTFYEAENFMLNLMKKSIIDKGNMMDCAKRAAVDKNLICFLDTTRAEVAISRSKIGGKNTLKIANVRFWSDSVAFLTGKRCPYRSKIDRIIMRMHDVGLIDKLYNDAKITLLTHDEVMDETRLKDENDMTSIHQHLMTIVISGYSISLLVFIIEILFYRKSKSTKLKKRATVGVAFIK